MKKINIALLIIILMALMMMLITSKLMDNPKIVEFKPYYVEQYDTLESIALKLNNNEFDVRELIYIIQKKNNIIPILEAGQEILIPVI